ncbi:Hypothetical protein CINCED_3A023152 [Cinara cedri]|uniref:Aspartic peptidase domain n=1 Tax=Cinara cedri TaxID=506608 RepID=A0A5E4N314_9HEMI|nr:Hypothetical protein CINCED_3A023152 [Cinara cedri]
MFTQTETQFSAVMYTKFRAEKLKNDQVTCRSPQTINNTIQFLLDSRSDLNLIKLSALKYDVLVYGKIIYQLKRITDQCVQTLGSAKIEVEIGNDSRTTEFHNFADLFFLEGDKITAITAVAHEIRTSDAVRPIHDKPYRLPAHHRQEMSNQMDVLERDGVIAPSDSPWNAPLLVVPKKPNINGKVKYWICVDFRRLNQVTIDDAFFLPNITDILDQLGK